MVCGLVKSKSTFPTILSWLEKRGCLPFFEAREAAVSASNSRRVAHGSDLKLLRIVKVYSEFGDWPLSRGMPEYRGGIVTVVIDGEIERRWRSSNVVYEGNESWDPREATEREVASSTGFSEARRRVVWDSSWVRPE